MLSKAHLTSHSRMSGSRNGTLFVGGEEGKKKPVIISIFKIAYNFSKEVNKHSKMENLRSRLLPK